MRRSSQLQMGDLSESRFPQTWACIRSGIADGVASGMVAGIIDLHAAGGAAWVAYAGQRRLVPSALPMEPETTFDLASLSKILTTATLSARLVERGHLRWDSDVVSFFPRQHLRGVQVRHLLSHTAGFEAWKPFWQELRASYGAGSDPYVLCDVPVADRQARMRSLVLDVIPNARPGERCVYSDVSALIMGFVIEEITGLSLDHAARKLLWDPMGLDGLSYHRTDSRGGRLVWEEVAATESCPWRKQVLQGQPHDDNCWAMGGYGGHAGVFGSIRDVLWFALKLFEEGRRSAVIQEMWTRVASPVGCERTLGWDTPSGLNPSVGQHFSAETVGHLGFTGVSLWMDLRAGLAVSLLTNRVHPSRENNQIREFRPRFHNAICEDWATQGR